MTRTGFKTKKDSMLAAGCRANQSLRERNHHRFGRFETSSRRWIGLIVISVASFILYCLGVVLHDGAIGADGKRGPTVDRQDAKDKTKMPATTDASLDLLPRPLSDSELLLVQGLADGKIADGFRCGYDDGWANALRLILHLSDVEEFMISSPILAISHHNLEHYSRGASTGFYECRAQIHELSRTYSIGSIREAAKESLLALNQELSFPKGTQFLNETEFAQAIRFKTE